MTNDQLKIYLDFLQTKLNIFLLYVDVHQIKVNFSFDFKYSSKQTNNSMLIMFNILKN